MRYVCRAMKIPGRKTKSNGSAVARLLFICVLLVACWLAYQNRATLVERVSALQADFMGQKKETGEASPSEKAPSIPVLAPVVAPFAEEVVKKDEVEEVAGEETPTQQAAPVATPAPVVVEETPDYAMIARTQAWWPKQVVLTKALAFPIIFNGKVAGEASVPPGTALALARVIAGQEETVEVVYNGSKQVIPAASTDLVHRAMAMKKLAESKVAGPAPIAAAAAVSAGPAAQPRVVASASTATASTAAPASPGAGSSAKAAERIMLEVVRKKLTRIEGGDWDDKKDRISLRVKFSNSDSKLSFDGYKAEIYTFGQSILDPRMTKLLGKQTFTFSLPPFGKHEVSTDECVTAYDTTDARFGHQYQGWIVRIKDKAGNLVIEKATNSTLAKSAEKLTNLQVNHETAR
jgi:hypothetical protein